MNELGGHPYFLIKFFFFIMKSRSNLKVRATKYCLDNVSSYGLKLTNYADNN